MERDQFKEEVDGKAERSSHLFISIYSQFPKELSMPL